MWCKTNIVFVALLCIHISAPACVFARLETQQDLSQQIRNWSVVMRRPDQPGCSFLGCALQVPNDTEEIRQLMHLRYLSRPDSNNVSCIVNTIEGTLNPIVSTGRYLLDYGPIPSMEHLTAVQMESLWGTGNSDVELSPRVVKRRFKTYRMLDSRNQDEYFIDLEITDKGRIKRYRVRCARLASLKWRYHTVQNSSNN